VRYVKAPCLIVSGRGSFGRWPLAGQFNVSQRAGFICLYVRLNVGAAVPQPPIAA
jgi:hypothetical protein